MQGSRNILVAMVGKHYGRGHCGEGVTQSQRGGHDWVAHGHIAGSCQVNVIPDADVAATDGRNPVPADCGMESGIIGAEDTAVEVGILLGLDFHTARIGIGDNKHFQFIVFFFQIGRDIKFSALEGSLDASQVVAVQCHLGFPVDAVKVEENALALHLMRQVK